MGTGVAPRKTLGMSSKLKLLQQQQHQRNQTRPSAQRGCTPSVPSAARSVSTGALIHLVAKTTTAKSKHANAACGATIQLPSPKRTAVAADPKGVAAAGDRPLARLRGDSGGGSRRLQPKRASSASPSKDKRAPLARGGARTSQSHRMSPLAQTVAQHVAVPRSPRAGVCVSTSATARAAASPSSSEAEARRGRVQSDEGTGATPPPQSTSVESALRQAAVEHAATRRRAPGVLVETLATSSKALLGKPLSERKQVFSACMQVRGHSDAVSLHVWLYLTQGTWEGCLHVTATLAMLILPPQSGRNRLRLAGNAGLDSSCPLASGTCSQALQGSRNAHS